MINYMMNNVTSNNPEKYWIFIISLQDYVKWQKPNDFHFCFSTCKVTIISVWSFSKFSHSSISNPNNSWITYSVSWKNLILQNLSNESKIILVECYRDLFLVEILSKCVSCVHFLDENITWSLFYRRLSFLIKLLHFT